MHENKILTCVFLHEKNDGHLSDTMKIMMVVFVLDGEVFTGHCYAATKYYATCIPS